MKYMLKLTVKSIGDRFGRYIAIFLIVFLSVAFFAGLKVTKPAMVGTCDTFLANQNMYDYRLISTLGLTQTDVEAFQELDYVDVAEGGKSKDVMLSFEEKEAAYKLIAMPTHLNKPSLRFGVMPQKEGECLADGIHLDESDLGKVFQVVSDEDGVSVKEFTIVGIIDSPIYLGTERGNTGIGNGRLSGFLYVLPEVLEEEVYTEIAISLKESEPAYSKDYENLIDKYSEDMEELLSKQAELRYEAILLENQIPEDMAEALGIQKADTYVLTRKENPGYVSFENDTAIVSGVANIFPFFFVLIALLVCITTMTRMVEEDRSFIGTLKSIGYSDGVITLKYIFYALSAALPGWLVGFVLGTWGLPQIFWMAYSSLYDFAPLDYYLSWPIGIGTLLVVLIGILGSTWLSCRQIMVEKPSELVRPKAPKMGGRIWLEYVTPIWSRIPFLGKIAIRNMFRYKSRLILMLIGIGCSCALVVTAFGVRDSMIKIGTEQFVELQTYDMEVTFEEKHLENVEALLEATDGVSEWKNLIRLDGTLKTSEDSSKIQIMAADSFSGYWKLHNGKLELSMPQKNEVLICEKLAQELDIAKGDTLAMEIDKKTIEVTVSGVLDNYLNKYVITLPETLAQAGISTSPNVALIKASKDSQYLPETFSSNEYVTGVGELKPSQESVDDALSCLNYIIWVIVLFSGMLAFTVIFNLTSINLAERRREVATVEVLGFYPKETESYILKENLLLSVLGAVIGLPLGTLLHKVVMDMIVIDLLSFRRLVTPISYVISVICTLAFAAIVNQVMKRQIKHINMAESLKAVE